MIVDRSRTEFLVPWVTSQRWGVAPPAVRVALATLCQREDPVAGVITAVDGDDSTTWVGSWLTAARVLHLEVVGPAAWWEGSGGRATNIQGWSARVKDIGTTTYSDGEVHFSEGSWYSVGRWSIEVGDREILLPPAGVRLVQGLTDVAERDAFMDAVLAII